MINRIKNIYEYRDMIYSLVRRELRGRYKGSVLGFLWTYVNPLCQVIVYSAVFSVIFRVNIEKFYLYLIIGMMDLFWYVSARGNHMYSRAIGYGQKDIFPQGSYSHFVCYQCICQHVIQFYHCLFGGIGIRIRISSENIGISSFNYGNPIPVMSGSSFYCIGDHCLLQGYGTDRGSCHDGLDLCNPRYVQHGLCP